MLVSASRHRCDRDDRPGGESRPLGPTSVRTDAKILIMPATQQKCLQVRPETVERTWHVVSARGRILGRLAAQIAPILMGKHRPDYTPHVDTGDFVIVTDAEKIELTGKKAQTKHYDHYTYHSGGHKTVSFAEMIAKQPEKVITEATRRMLPKTKLGRHMLSKLKVYRGSDHPHSAQQPKPLELK